MHDYIIIGAGSAGCVMANRLSKIFSTNVMLLEAGGKDTNPFIQIPAKDGKPFYISGPNETAPQARKIVDKLFHRCGVGNFDYIVNVADFD